MFGLRFLSALGIMKLKEKRMFSCILKKFGENMISYIKGTLERRGENDIIVEAGGIGYRIFVSPATLAKLPQTGEAVQIFTYFSVKEDGMSLYGFAAREEQEMFEKLEGTFTNINSTLAANREEIKDMAFRVQNEEL